MDNQGTFDEKLNSNYTPVPPPGKASLYWLIFIISAALAFGVICSLASCSTQKERLERRRAKQTAKLDKVKAKCDADDNLKSVPPMWCSTNYKPKDRFVIGKPTTTESKGVKPGKPTTRTVNCDSAYKAGARSVIVECPPCDTVTIYKLTTLHDTTFQEDVAMIAALNIRCDSLKQSYNDTVRAKQELVYREHDISVKHQANAVKWQRWFGYLAGVNLGLLALGVFIWYQRRKINFIKNAGKYV